MLTGIVIGAGDRGYDAYARHTIEHADLGRIVGVAERDAGRRHRFAERYDLSDDACFDSWDAIFAEPQMADWALVATGDRHHVEPTLLALEAGYHVLLEKPMALDVGDCERLVAAAEKADRVLAVCHVYRFSRVFDRVHELITHGAVGDIVSIQHSENVAFWHHAHSYVRGLTRHSDVPFLLQKSCHDLDLLSWFAGAPAARVASFARPTELTDANAPAGAPEHCIEGCPHAPECPYDAVAIYRDLTPVLGDLGMTDRPLGLGPVARAARTVRPKVMNAPIPGLRRSLDWWRWPVSAVTDDHTPKGLDHALRTTRWGRCAWKVGDNDQPSAQTVLIEFANGVEAAFTLQSTSYRTMRRMRIDGLRGSIEAELHSLDGEIIVADHKSGRVRKERIAPAYDGHGGGEEPMFRDFLAAIAEGREPRTSARASLESHRIAFAAMTAAADNTVVELG